MLRTRVGMGGHAKDQGRDRRTYLRPRQSVSVPFDRALLLEASQHFSSGHCFVVAGVA